MLSRFIKGGKATTVRMPQTFNVNKGPGEFASPRLLDTPARGWKIDTLWRAVLRWQPDEMAK
jgi:hypothetical protein